MNVRGRELLTLTFKAMCRVMSSKGIVAPAKSGAGVWAITTSGGTVTICASCGPMRRTKHVSRVAATKNDLVFALLFMAVCNIALYGTVSYLVLVNAFVA